MTVLEDSIDLAEELFDTFPLLIYPCRIYNHGEHKGQLRLKNNSFWLNLLSSWLIVKFYSEQAAERWSNDS